MTKRIDITDYGAVNGGEVLCTTAIQQAIDRAAELECEVYSPEGVYLTGALFLKSNMSLHLVKGATLLGTMDKSAFPIKCSLVAGVNMECQTGIINAFQATHVRVYGAGIIDGQGCFNVIVRECSDVQLEDFCSVRSGIWNIHIGYSENIGVKGLRIIDNSSPEMNGIVIDSCNGVLVEKCRISCKDDNVCIRSGRDTDVMCVNHICENIMVRDCKIFEGMGITLDCKHFGGMRNISVCDNTYKGTSYGFRVKSVKNRGSMIEDVEVTNLKMEDVCCCFCFEIKESPVYDYCEISYAGNVRISKVTSVISEKYQGSVRAFAIKGLPEVLFKDCVFENMHLQITEYGTITNVKNLRFIDVMVDVVS